MKKHRRKQRLYLIFSLIMALGVFIILFLAVVIYANWNAFTNEINYTVAQSQEPTPTPVPTPTPIIESAHIIIEKINADLPIQWDVAPANTIEALNHGVAHLVGTVHPGQIGNTFITGHSSDYVWKHNPYAAAFSLLPKLTVGDTITIRENGKMYVYKVAQTKIVKPSQVEVANATTTPVLTLMTCYPVGSTRERYIVHASLVSSPEKPVSQQSGTNYTLPEIKFR